MPYKEEEGSALRGNLLASCLGNPNPQKPPIIVLTSADFGFSFLGNPNPQKPPRINSRLKIPIFWFPSDPFSEADIWRRVFCCFSARQPVREIGNGLSAEMSCSLGKNLTHHLKYIYQRLPWKEQGNWKYFLSAFFTLVDNFGQNNYDCYSFGYKFALRIMPKEHLYDLKNKKKLVCSFQEIISLESD